VHKKYDLHRWSHGSNLTKSSQGSGGSGSGGRKGSHDSRSGSIVSASNVPPWQRKASVTIVEGVEDEKDFDEEALDDIINRELRIKPLNMLRRASSVGEPSEDHVKTSCYMEMMINLE